MLPPRPLRRPRRVPLTARPHPPAELRPRGGRRGVHASGSEFGQIGGPLLRRPKWRRRLTNAASRDFMETAFPISTGG